MIFGKSIAFDREGLLDSASAAHDPLVFGAEGEDFIESLKAGDPKAFDNLVLRYSADIYSVLFRLTRDAEEAADLTQETFLSALKAMKGFRGDSELKTWLYRIAVNHSRNRFRWWKRRRVKDTVSLDETVGEGPATIGDGIAGNGPSAEETVLRRERETSLIEALQKLPATYREPVVLCDIEGLTYEEIATVLGLNIGTVKSRISRGRDELRRILTDF